MRRLLAALSLCATLAVAETIDRAAVRVGNEIITASAIRRHLRLQAFFEQRDADLRTEARKLAASRLVDQILVRRELELTRYTPPSESEVDAQVAEIAKARGEEPAALAASAVRYGFSMDELRAELRYQVALLRFVDFRFSAGVQVSAEEIEEAYQKEIVAEAGKRKVEAPKLEDVRAKLESLIAYRKTTAAMEQWLQQARQQVKVRYFEEAFE